MVNIPGADLGFSRGGGADFQKVFQNFDDLFCKIFCAAGKFLKQTVKKAVFGHFLKNFDKKSRFFLARVPPQS